MKTIDNYITEKLHLRGDNKSLYNDKSQIEKIDEYVGQFNNEIQTKLVKLINCCLNELSNKKRKIGDECYIVYMNDKKDANSYAWASNRYDPNKRKIGDKLPLGVTIDFILTKDNDLPDEYILPKNRV